MIVWYIVGAWFLLWEGIALLTKEKWIPTLSRTIWRWTAWQTGGWKVDFWIEMLPGGYNVMFKVPTFRPLRWVVFVTGIWATLHLSFGECAFGIC